MFKKIFILIFIWAISFSLSFADDVEVKASLEPISKDDRILILAPHPDDEDLGCGGLIQKALKAKAQVKIAYLTNGDHNEFAFLVYEKMPILTNAEFIKMGKLREQEAKSAMKVLGMDEKDLTFFGYPDYGTDTMFFSYWDSSRPFKDKLTRQPSVPYKESPSYGAPYKPENILNDLKKLLMEYRPNKIFVSHPVDVNGDHWAYYCYLQIALRDLRKEITPPQVYPYLVHAVGWPIPRHYHPGLNLNPYVKHFPDNLVEWKKLALTKDEIDKKYQAMLCYKSQTCVSAFYLLSFVRQNELYGDYPLIELEGQPFSPDADRDSYFKDKNKVSYAVVDGYFWVRVSKPEYLKQRLFFNFYILGYSDNVPFAKMPNIWIATKFDKFKITEMNSAREIDPQGTSVELAKDYFYLKVPLKLLGDPDFILTCVTTDKSFLPFESTAFRRIEIKDKVLVK